MSMATLKNSLAGLLRARKILVREETKEVGRDQILQGIVGPR